MNFTLSEEQCAIQSLAREILEQEVTPERRNEIASDPDGFDRKVWAELGKANLLGAALPESAGGSDCGFLGLCLLLEEVGRTLAPIPALPTLAIGAISIAEFGTDAQKRRLLPGDNPRSPAQPCSIVEFEMLADKAVRDGTGR